MTDNHIAGAPEADPLKSVADAMETAVQAARDGAADAKAAVDRAIPAISQFVSRFVYTTSYSLSYGFVFPAMLLVRAVPKDNALVHGLVDGVQAAKDMVEDWKGGQASPRSRGTPHNRCMTPGEGVRFEPRSTSWRTAPILKRGPCGDDPIRATEAGALPMPITRSEVIYLAAGVAVGVAARSAYPQLKEKLGPLLAGAGPRWATPTPRSPSELPRRSSPSRMRWPRSASKRRPAARPSAA